MSDAYAKEFEKWLLEKKGDTSPGEETEEDEDREDCFMDDDEQDSDIGMNVINNDESEEERSQKLYISEQNNKHNLSGSVNDLAPILLDDDDEDLIPSEKQQYEDEPPVLEPVPKHVGGSKISTVGSISFSPQKCIRNYSRYNQPCSKKSAGQEQEKPLKTYSNKIKHISSDSCEETSHHSSNKYKDKESGNIFDKFNSMSESYEDVPPPLIPSPEAAGLHCESLDAKHPSHSPDFCAMEADSTSEITGDKAGDISGSRRISKNSFHGDVSIECDSTCMLGTSPVIVSPASVSNGDTDDARDPGGGGGGGEGETEGDTKKCDDSSQDKLEVEGQSASSEAKNSLNGCMSEDSSKATSSDKYPELTRINRSSGAHDSFPHTVKLEFEDEGSCNYPNDPPILSVISPPAKPYSRSRKKRHTIDSADTFSRSGKRPRTVASPRTDNENVSFDISSPPTLTNVSETVITFTSRGKRSKIVTDHPKKDCPCCTEKPAHRKRRRRRCNTLPFADLSEYVDHLPEDLRSFVVNTTELSLLQSRMHKLLHQLFPQLRSELDSMSPESSQFERLLSDLVIALEQPEEEMEEEDCTDPPPLIPCKDVKPTFAAESQKIYPKISVLDIGISLGNTSSISSLSSLHDSQAAASNATKDNQNTDAICSPLLSLSRKSRSNSHEHKSNGYFRVKQPQDSTTDMKDSDLVIPQLSQLTLKETEDILRPSRVILHRDPEASLIKFGHLSCSALQLLLPDLTVSLGNELAQSPNDLVVFIDNVLLTNSKRQSRL